MFFLLIMWRALVWLGQYRLELVLEWNKQIGTGTDTSIHLNYAIRYPDAVSLKKITTKAEAEALLDIYSRVEESTVTLRTFIRRTRIILKEL